MRASISFLLPLLLAGACNDYDLYRDNDAKPVDTGTPVHEEEPEHAPDILVYCANDEECDKLDFGFVMQDCPSDWLQVTIENAGDADLVVSSIEVVGSGESYFQVDATPPTLAPGETYTFGVQFTPAAQATYEPELQVTSNDPDEPTATLPVEGTGAEYSIFEETFHQGVFESVDVLWVVDNSGSMSEEISLVEADFDTFINQFVDLDLDYHLGIITLDMDSPRFQGRLQGTPTYVTSEMDPAEVVSDTLNVLYDIFAVGGSGSERGLDAIQAALSEPLVSTDNAGFMRDYDDFGNEVAIAAIVVTDEADDSNISPTAFTSWFQGLKTDPSKATLSTVCGDPPSGANWLGGCTNFSNGTSAGEAGSEYIEVANATGGIFSSICNDDYSQVLQHLSVTAAGMEVSFPLTHEPTSVSEMVVEVDGEPVDYYSGYTGDGWKYDSDANAVVFYGDAIPGPGSTIYVSYPYDSGC